MRPSLDLVLLFVLLSTALVPSASADDPAAFAAKTGGIAAMSMEDR